MNPSQVPSEHASIEILRDLIPLGSLSPEACSEVLRSAETQEYAPGQLIFRQGDRDDHALYLIHGQIALFNDGRVVKRVSEGTEAARYALAHLQPRQYSGRAESPVEVLRVDRRILERMLTQESPGPRRAGDLEVGELEGNESGDWMTRLLRSDLFARMPAANLQRIFTAVEHVELEAGTLVIRQGDPGDYYYILVSGRAEVVRQTASGSEVRLAELGHGDSFGEDALVGDTTRNATVRLLTDAELVRLSREDFVELIRKPTLRAVSLTEAQQLAARGALWIDVRYPDEHAVSHIEGSLNIPLNLLRLQAGRLDAGRTHLVYCDTGNRSAVGAFLLAQKGYDARLVEGGFLRAAVALEASPIATPQLARATVSALPPVEEPMTTPSLAEIPSSGAADTPALRREGERLRSLARQLERRLSEEQSARRAEIARHRDEMGRLRSLLELGEARLREVQGQQVARCQGLERELARAVVDRDAAEEARVAAERREAEGGAAAEERLRAQERLTAEALATVRDLQESLSATRADVNAVEAARAQANEEMAHRGDELSRARQEIERLTAEMAESMRRQQRAEAVRASETAVRVSEQETLARRAEHAEAQLGAALEAVARAEQRASTAERDAQDLRARLDQTEATLADLTRELEQQRTARQAEQKARREAEQQAGAEAAALRARADQLAADLTALRERHQGTEQTLEAERKTHRQVHAELEAALAEESSALQVLRGALEGELQRVEQRASAAEREAQDLRGQAAQGAATIAELTREIEEQRAARQAEQKARREAQHHAEAESAALHARADQLAADLAALRERHQGTEQTLEAERKTHRHARAELEAALAEERSALQTLQGALEGQLQRAEQRASAAEREAQDLRARVAQGEAALAERTRELEQQRGAAEQAAAGYERRLAAVLSEGDSARASEVQELGRRLEEEQARQEAQAIEQARIGAETESRRRELEAEVESLRTRLDEAMARAGEHERRAGDLVATDLGRRAEIEALRADQARGEEDLRQWRQVAEDRGRETREEAARRIEAEKALDAARAQATERLARASAEAEAALEATRAAAERAARNAHAELSTAARAREAALERERERLATELSEARAALTAAEIVRAELEHRLRVVGPTAEAPGTDRARAQGNEAEDDEAVLVPKALREALVKKRQALEHTRQGGNT